jgi:S-adenosylmethionine decarboxylase
MWGLAAVDLCKIEQVGRLSLSETPACRHSEFFNLVGEDGMRQAALLRSDKGLGTPGTDRKRAKPAVAPVNAKPAVVPTIADDDRKDHFVVRNGVRCAGVHLIVDLYGAQYLDNIDRIDEALRKCVSAAGATLLHIHLHHFEPNGGVSGVAVLAESHISIHTWPEADYAAIDIFMCGRATPDACVPVLREAFKPARVAVGEHLRGQGA